MAVPGQCIVYSDSKVFGFRSFFQGLSVNAVGSLYGLNVFMWINPGEWSCIPISH